MGDCRSRGASGSHGKSQPPAMLERFKVADSRPSGRCDDLAVPTIFVVTAQIFPSETSGRDVLCVPVCRRRSPIDAEHGVTSPSRDAGQRPAKRGSRITGNIEPAQSRYLEYLTRSFFGVFCLATAGTIEMPARMSTDRQSCFYPLENTWTSPRAVSIVNRSPPISASRAIACQST